MFRDDNTNKSRGLVIFNLDRTILFYYVLFYFIIFLFRT